MKSLLPYVITTFMLVCMAVTPSHAQQFEGEFARVVVIKPKPGLADEFMEGYKRHIIWHEKNKDPWPWYGWTFVLGDRIGQFMDGTFGHDVRNFDQAIDPAGDAKDNSINVMPYGDFISHGVYERLANASIGAPVPDSSPYLVLATYLVAIGQESAFEAAFARQAKRLNQRLSLYRVRVGGRAGQYVLMRPAQSFAEGASLERIEFPAGLVDSAQTELLRFQPDHSLIPQAHFGCSSDRDDKICHDRVQ